jgi:DNA-binding transcriptional LysR family regulator
MKPAESFFAISYRYFLAVAESGSVRAAARQLNVAASAISRQLILLEQQLGVALFDRGGRQLELSLAGTVLLKGLRSAAQGYEATIDELSALRGLKRGEVRVATVESISVSVLPDLLVAFARNYPGIQVTVTVAGSDAVTELVRDHRADIGFTFNPATLDGLEVELTRVMQIGAAVAPDHPLAKARKLSLADCLEFPVAWPSRGLSLRAILDRGVAPGRRRFQPAFECNSLRLMASLAKRGACVAFQTPIGIEQDIAERKLVFIPLQDRRLPADRLMIVRRKGQPGRLAADAFVSLTMQHLEARRPVRK